MAQSKTMSKGEQVIRFLSLIVVVGIIILIGYFVLHFVVDQIKNLLDIENTKWIWIIIGILLCFFLFKVLSKRKLTIGTGNWNWQKLFTWIGCLILLFFIIANFDSIRRWSILRLPGESGGGFNPTGSTYSPPPPVTYSNEIKIGTNVLDSGKIYSFYRDRGFGYSTDDGYRDAVLKVQKQGDASVSWEVHFDKKTGEDKRRNVHDDLSMGMYIVTTNKKIVLNVIEEN